MHNPTRSTIFTYKDLLTIDGQVACDRTWKGNWVLNFVSLRDRIIDIESIAIAALCYKADLPSIIAYNQFQTYLTCDRIN
ncbi:hypothetical protein [Tolypothrix sp. VBCCA 56010]|uniref:hypothetical protein n=1 Tax=Tolypothrix sp. VBCCA 56010 TaxID=3137731 RepID=UPI003D7CF184